MAEERTLTPEQEEILQEIKDIGETDPGFSFWGKLLLIVGKYGGACQQ